MKLEDLNKQYDKLQLIYGDENLDSIYNGGCDNNPDICFVFMNPTKRILAASKSWQGLKSPWIGIKNIWYLFYEVGLLEKELYEKIKKLKREEWTEEFATDLYQKIKEQKYFITNLAKCTLDNARAIPDSVYKEYLNLFYQELEIVNPKVTILFGNQVSSIVLDEKIEVSKVRRQEFTKVIYNKPYKFYSVYYPIGNGRYNIDKSIADIKWIIDNLKKEQSNYSLKPTTSKDIPKLIEYKLNNIFTYTKNLEEAERQKIIAYVDSHVPLSLPNYRLIVKKHRLIGCLQVEPHKDGVLIGEIYLEEEYRNQNIGTQIIKKLIQDNSIIYLFVYKDNQKAFSLYERLGFKIIDETETRYYMIHQKDGNNWHAA